MDKQIVIVKKQVGKEATAIRIENTLEEMQEIVGGYIESVNVRIGSKEYSLVCNEEGKLKELEVNLIFPGDVIVGDIFISAFDGDEDFRTLEKDEVIRIKKWINFWSY